MKRQAFIELKAWKESEDRKPLILKGARQVGKTWLMKEFGKNYYSNYYYFNFDENPDLNSIFINNKNPEKIIELLSILAGKKITSNDTLIIFDEIQECPEALNSLKYFYENANDYHIIAAGSLLGTLLATPKSYPVGMVNIINIYPLNFLEFLEATDELLYEYVCNIKKGQKIESIFHNKLIEAYNYYLIIGGMPECVASWLKYKDLDKVARRQNELIQLYENDITKHNGKINSGRILLVLRSIVSQLAKENEKFIYSSLRGGARARAFEEAIEWLVSAGLLNRIYNVSKVGYPMSAYIKFDAFKLFMFDTGLLKRMAGLNNSSIMFNSDYQFKGPLTENFVLQQIKNMFDVNPCYFSINNSELDFIVQNGEELIVMEVKGGDDKTSPSFKRYIKETQPKNAIRYSKLGYRKDGAFVNIPLYLINRTKDLLEK